MEADDGAYTMGRDDGGCNEILMKGHRLNDDVHERLVYLAPFCSVPPFGGLTTR